MLPGSRHSTGVPFASLSFFFFSALTVEKTSSDATMIKTLAIIASTRVLLSDCIVFLLRRESGQFSWCSCARGKSLGQRAIGVLILARQDFAMKALDIC